ncbi:multicopper oxidase family protein [Alicyclobacillus macrosporangiidus]|uniref:Multicopper oxidase with three cupredoxin domains (Includes cell division protein FtsP and spore coat protein CotA) n=1 Tax=Alicyclobacillus macrosporangiidus TaxID=392015 RepID=A0A1I7L8H2_9BACL|nr:multicopper oxidase family protein [Alicyclobacillus macrosporangiidus]SFV05945.1 Multicopper oxidase with three cupredoxin domains (includes cell division protein FtsP and spore coat protein CotA) [Alicyclobacillus macrosporangiidus]
MKKQHIALYSAVAVLAVAAGSGYYAWSMHRTTNAYTAASTGPLVQTVGPDGKLVPVSALVANPPSGAHVQSFTLTAEEKSITLGGKTVKAMTFNGTAPGPLLKVHQGDLVEATVRNQLSVPITVHWHGIAVPGSQDGVPGLTQDPIQPGGSYVYRFVANQAGTYWYHSHVNSVQEIGLGLYGGIVVLPKSQTAPAADRDYTLLLHEWSTSPSPSTDETMGNMTGMSGMNGMSMGSMGSMGNMSGMGTMHMGSPDLRTNGFQVTDMDKSALGEMTNMYDAYTINQNASGQTMLEAKPGETVRLRLVNAGNMTHLMTLVGTPFKVVAMDGQDIANPTPIENQLLPIGAAERYDIDFTMPKSGKVQLVSGDPDMTERMQLRATIGDTMASGTSSMSDMPDVQREPWFGFTRYGSGSIPGVQTFNLDQKFDKTFSMDLGAGMNQSGMVYTINGKAFPDVPPFVVKAGDTVKVHIENKSAYIHPMHLHGHIFQVLSRDGKPITGSPIFLDTLQVLPGETYDIAFKADNPGLWMFHCHDLHHASAGMDVVVQYAGVTDPYNLKDMSE